MILCPLCDSNKISLFQRDPFLRCDRCSLIFKDPVTRLTMTEEKTRYQTHQNSRENEGYVNFLMPVVGEVKKHVPERARILDYGCGPGPVLSELLQDEAYKVFRYDPFFYPHGLENLPRKDAITCTEAAEHFFFPQKEFDKMFSLMKPEAPLILMTDIFKEDTDIADWYYTKDPTHVCFYSRKTLEWVAEKFKRTYVEVSHRLCVLKNVSGAE